MLNGHYNICSWGTILIEKVRNNQKPRRKELLHISWIHLYRKISMSVWWNLNGAANSDKFWVEKIKKRKPVFLIAGWATWLCLKSSKKPTSDVSYIRDNSWLHQSISWLQNVSIYLSCLNKASIYIGNLNLTYQYDWSTIICLMFNWELIFAFLFLLL